MATKSSGSSSSGSRSRSRQSSNGGGASQASQPAARRRSQQKQNGGAGDPDVLIDVPQLKVEEIGLEVDNLHARIALEAKLGDLLELHVGADVVADRVALEIKGVDAQAQLKARLDNVFTILDRTLKTVDENPEILTQLAQNSTAQASLQAAGGDDEE
jgi:hypothetical protein